jgi:hypothetical protein
LQISTFTVTVWWLYFWPISNSVWTLLPWECCRGEMRMSYTFHLVLTSRSKSGLI